MFGKRKIATVVAEFLGTGILTLLVLSVQRSTIGVPFFVSLIAGITLTVMVFAVGGTSGSYLNPAITIGLWTARKLSSLTTVVYVAAELLGAWGAYYLYTYFVNSKLAPIGGHFSGRTLAAEAVGTGIFAFVWAAASYQKWSRSLTAPVVGGALMVGMIAASAGGIGLANPALALGVRAFVWGTYVLGPVLGAVIGVNLYGQLFAETEGATVKAVATTSSATTSSSSKTTTKKPAAKKPAARKTARKTTKRTTRR
jgi:glycerol uptake facilitator-like aquaporin